MTRLVASLAVVASVLSGVGSLSAVGSGFRRIALATSQTPLFRANTNLVRVDVLAVDRGKPIANLTAADFELLDNGVAQSIDAIYAEHEPLDLLFVFDRSASVRGPTLARLKEAAAAVLDQLTDEDRAAVLTFDQSFKLAAPFQSDRALVRQMIDRLEAGGSTSLFDALYTALTLAEHASRRAVVVLFTDGVDNLSWLRPADVLKMARESDAVVYAVAYQASGGDPVETDLLGQLAQATGGRVLSAARSDRLTQAFLEILEEMRARYLLTYSPEHVASGWHELSVRLRHHRGRVTARRGYFVP